METPSLSPADEAAFVQAASALLAARERVEFLREHPDGAVSEPWRAVQAKQETETIGVSHAIVNDLLTMSNSGFHFRRHSARRRCRGPHFQHETAKPIPGAT